MALEIIRNSNTQLICGEAKPGANLTFLGKSMAQFCIKFNKETLENKGEIVKVRIVIYSNRNYEYYIKKTPSINLIKKKAGEKKELNNEDLEEIAKIMMSELNVFNKDIEKAKKIIAGTARSAGIKLL